MIMGYTYLFILLLYSAGFITAELDPALPDSAPQPAESSTENNEKADNSSSEIVAETDNDDESEENVQADLNEHSLFSVEGEGAEATIRVNNHSRLGLIIAEAFVKDHLFVLKKGKVVLKPRIEEPERVSEKMFNAIRDIAVPYYSELDSIKSLETEATSSKIIDGLVALQYVNLLGSVLRDGIKTMKKIVKDLDEWQGLRDAYFRNEKNPSAYKIKKIRKRMKLLKNHRINKYESYREAIMNRLPEEFKDQENVPTFVLNELKNGNDDENASTD
ncbi:hypothetical protein DdX_00961 [Ditylenchus destructor]|uniref:Uncharacterized protein n=1 Tax=Ditylenchus destructor TaxID=166010 RepID=A0AAD4NJP6_9BILA|nr:hypothetical protein DdX_00961 [Ditylenchus destructor]